MPGRWKCRGSPGHGGWGGAGGAVLPCKFGVILRPVLFSLQKQN